MVDHDRVEVTIRRVTVSNIKFAEFRVYKDGVLYDDTIFADIDGIWSFDLGGVTGTFTAEAVDTAGNISTLSSAVVVGGSSNTPASISGDAAGAVSEDGTLSDNGILTVTDPDAGEDALQAVTQLGDSGHGTFDVTAGGWTYTLANGDPAVQALAEGATLTDTITVSSVDGTASQVITVTITGTNDVPIITGDTSGGVTEDGSTTTGGTLTVTDADTGQSALQAVTNGVGDGGHGSFDVQTNGIWTYTLTNGDPAVQALAQGATLTDTIIVLSVDGTPSAITVTITGANDVPTITGATTGEVSEDGTPTATGFASAPSWWTRPGC